MVSLCLWEVGLAWFRLQFPEMYSSLGYGSVLPENEEGSVLEVIENVPQNSEGLVPEGHVTNLAMLSRLHCLEESNLTHWIFEFGRRRVRNAYLEHHAHVRTRFKLASGLGDALDS